MTDTQFDKLIGWLEIKFTAIDDRFDRLDGCNDRLDARIAAYHAEMLERFQSVNDRLDALERRVANLADSQDTLRDNVSRITTDLAALRRDLVHLDARLNFVERGLHDVSTKIAALGDDMRQRFRVLTERVAAVEQKLAA